MQYFITHYCTIYLRDAAPIVSRVRRNLQLILPKATMSDDGIAINLFWTNDSPKILTYNYLFITIISIQHKCLIYALGTLCSAPDFHMTESFGWPTVLQKTHQVHHTYMAYSCTTAQNIRRRFWFNVDDPKYVQQSCHCCRILYCVPVTLYRYRLVLFIYHSPLDATHCSRATTLINEVLMTS